MKTPGMLLLACTLWSSIAIAEPTPAPTPTPLGDPVPVLLIEAEAHSAATGTLRPVHETDASAGQSLAPTGVWGNFSQYQFRVPISGAYILVARLAPGTNAELQILLEGPGALCEPCPNCTAGEWFGMPERGGPGLGEGWEEWSTPFCTLSAETTYTMTVRVLGELRLDWLRLDLLEEPSHVFKD